MSVKRQAVLLVAAAGEHTQEDLNAVVTAADAVHDASLLQLAWEARTSPHTDRLSHAHREQMETGQRQIACCFVIICSRCCSGSWE